ASWFGRGPERRLTRRSGSRPDQDAFVVSLVSPRLTGQFSRRPVSLPSVGLSGLCLFPPFEEFLTLFSSRGLLPGLPLRLPLGQGSPAAADLSVSQEPVRVEDSPMRQHVIDRATQLVGQYPQRLARCVPAPELLQVPADAVVLLGGEHGGLAERPLQPGVALLAAADPPLLPR